MKNVILASMLAFGVSAFANETAPAASTAPAGTETAAPAPEAGKMEKKAKHAGHKKMEKKGEKKVEAGK